MKTFSRRDVLKTTLLAPAAVAAVQSMGPMSAAMEIPREPQSPSIEPITRDANDKAMKSAGRERLLLDFGWRFHFGNADDPAKDFGFGSGATGNFQKTGNFMPAGTIAFDDSEWREVDLPHDWAVELPFQNDPALASKGFYPAGTQISCDQRRLVSPRVRSARRGCRQADHDRIRWLIPRDDGGLQRLLHRPPQRRVRSLQLRSHRLRHSRRQECAAGARGRDFERRMVL